ncbi:MAG: response regulator [Niastella sp.]|nr:response regulator [Niastella sp.]
MEFRKALIVDDEKDTCFLLTRLLQQHAYEVHYVHSLLEAAPILQKENPDVIFLDNHLKDGQGIDYVPTLKEAYPDLKIIIITAFDNFAYKTKAFEKGAHYFLGKPFNRNNIEEALNSLFNN